MTCKKGECSGDGRFANRPYNGLILHDFPFQLRDTNSACCVIEQNDKNPRGWGKGVCNTPLHFITEHTDIVSLLFGRQRLNINTVNFVLAKKAERSAFLEDLLDSEWSGGFVLFSAKSAHHKISDQSDRPDHEREEESGRHPPSGHVALACIKVDPTPDEQIEGQKVQPPNRHSFGGSERGSELVELWIGEHRPEARKLWDDQYPVQDRRYKESDHSETSAEQSFCEAPARCKDHQEPKWHDPKVSKRKGLLCSHLLLHQYQREGLGFQREGLGFASPAIKWIRLSSTILS